MMVTIFSILRRLLRVSTLTSLMIVGGAPAVYALTQSTNVGGGTLSWTVTQSTGVCGEWHTFTFTEWSLSNFQFLYGGTTYPLSGSAAYLQDNNSTIGCPPNGPEPAVLPLSTPSSVDDGCAIDFTAESGGQGSASISSTCVGVQGYIDPKYVVLGVTYAPPGPNSFVTYTNSSSVGITTSLINTFTSSTTLTTSVSTETSIPGFKSGHTVSNAATATESSKSTNTVTLNWGTANSIKTYGTPTGTPAGFQPVDNDYDIVYVWLNPVLVFTVSGSNVTWNGYGYDANDQNGMDIVGIPLGYLNGHFGAMPADILASTNRTWANSVLTGPSPALTSVDFAQIAAFDPFDSSSYGPDEIGYDPPIPDTADGRFTLTTCNGGNSVSYGQAAPSQAPSNYTCTLSYSSLTTNAEAFTFTASDTFSIDNSFTEGGVTNGFGTTFTEDVKFANTFSYQFEVDNSISTTQSSSALLSITDLACNNTTPDIGPCVPVYDAGSNEPVQFFVYQDSLYGTFMLAPVDYFNQ